jgi:ABC-2 type transport system ATP-binding protein
MGLLRAQAGSVRVFGLNPVHDPVGVLGRIGYLSEERDLPEWMTINELMRYTSAFFPRWDQAYADDLLDTFALDPGKKIKELSKGMRAQAGLVVAVAHRPDLLILDEPSSGLDAVVRADILQAIVRTISDEGKTVVFSSHLLEEVERLSDHVTMIHQGRVVLNGTLESVKELHLRSQIRFPQVLDALPPLEGVLAKDGSGRAWTLTHSAETSVADRLSAAIAAMGGEVIQSREATLEEIFIARVGRAADKQANETQTRQAA